jgi:hypothetical protein
MPSGTLAEQRSANPVEPANVPGFELSSLRKVLADVVAVEGADLTIADVKLGLAGQSRTRSGRVIRSNEEC